jgi:ceramide glucosyltransferase
VTAAIIVIASAAGLYQILAIIAALSHRRRRTNSAAHDRPVSILKPVYGKDAGFYEAIRTHALQQYSEFEILFGIRRQDDPARSEVERLMHEFPALPIRVVLCGTTVPNLKVGSLIDLARAARHPILIVNDSDISVPAGYIRDVTAPLADQNIGMVTCLYRAEAHDWPSRLEALAIATDFAPSTLVARLFGVSDFGLGSTLAFRKADLERMGGFQAIGDYIADDYQLGHQLHALGLRNVISEVVVSTRLSSGSWLGAWHHQVRWARTIRLSGGAGYIGLPITYASLWAAIAALCGLWWIALPLLAIRLAMAIACGWFVLGSADVWKYCYAIPVRDLCGVAVWAAGLFSRSVVWRDQRLTLDAEGRIVANSRIARN